MEIYEFLTVALVVVLAAATTAAIYYGLLGMIGQFFIVRCASCGHLTTSAADSPCVVVPSLSPSGAPASGAVLHPRRHLSE